jgi:hypothetical protein
MHGQRRVRQTVRQTFFPSFRQTQTQARVNTGLGNFDQALCSIPMEDDGPGDFDFQPHGVDKPRSIMPWLILASIILGL